ncbi:ATP-binding cassette domain-containing protein [Raoultibacter massiliensis]|uniref:ATP-binding cassette domain-containing protein n=1 Tax=Raoultibacter massiliensis TaxID=1852371 RepID=A0ABV1JC45_9ACTN|nr:ATP-binding cassette domain-containing protein [Raoultibacter massiliensis]
MFITLHDITYTYEDAPNSALENLSVTFADGWTGIVGSNGAGKSTLLKLLCGICKPDSGSIRPAVSGVYCAQATEDAPVNLLDFASDYSADAVRLRTMLELEDDWLWRYDTLSHGERKRIQIACALSLNPAVVSLDEPTNHLDRQTRAVLLDALKEYRGIGLLVSHDRLFLDELVSHCLFLESGKGTMIPGAYTSAKEQLDLREKTSRTERKNARDQLARAKTEAARRKNVAGQSSARRSGSKLDKHDSDGREKLRLAVYSGQDGKAGLLSAQMDKKIEFAQERLDGARTKKIYDKPLDIHAEPSKRRYVAHVQGGAVQMGETRRLLYPDIFVGPTDRIALRGRNGAGKSTFLKMLLAGSFDLGDRLVYIPQEVTPEEGREFLEKLKGGSSSHLGGVLSIVARLNSPPERILSGEELSPGELRKAMLAVGLLESPQLIVMDEPTNHLDLPSIEALQNVLAQCACALVLVSHDEAFLSALTDISWNFEGGGIAAGGSCRGDTVLVVS